VLIGARRWTEEDTCLDRGVLRHSFYSFPVQPKTITAIPSKAIPAPVQSKAESFSPSTTFSQTRAAATRIGVTNWGQASGVTY